MNASNSKYQTLPTKLQQNSTQKLPGIFLEPKQIAKDDNKMKNFIERIYGEDPEDTLEGFIQFLQDQNKQLRKLQTEQYQLMELEQEQERLQTKKLFQQKISQLKQIQKLNDNQVLEFYKQEYVKLVNIDTEYTIPQSKMQGKSELFLSYHLSEKQQQYYQQMVTQSQNLYKKYKQQQFPKNEKQKQIFFQWVQQFQEIMQNKRIKTLVKIFGLKKRFLVAIKKYKDNQDPKLFLENLFRLGRPSKKIQNKKNSYQIVNQQQIQFLQQKLDNYEQIKTKKRLIVKNLVPQIRKIGIKNSKDIKEVQQQQQLSYNTLLKYVKQLNYVQLKSKYVILDRSQLYQQHIKERLVYCTFLCLLLSQGMQMSCLDEAYAHLDNGQNRMWGLKGKRVKWPQVSPPEKLGFIISLNLDKPIGIQMIRNTGYQQPDIVQFIDQNNQQFQDISQQFMVQDNATSHVGKYSKNKIIDSGTTVLCNASRFPQANPAEIIIGQIKSQLPKYKLQATMQDLSNSLCKGFLEIKPTWIIGAYISAYDNCIEFLQSIQQQNFFDQ